ncbi:Adenosine kinase [Spraguea lophii 42_110]|uniref:Adenosine kinase n=1 Tax=Spraguea lophii (strain 42_110) TaxID=1358809 RepID=S7W7X9_SPRLO|nr:Adenosine kinase [Spraguea lophii 42_110]
MYTPTMSKYSVLFVCEPIIDIFIKYNDKLMKKYNMSVNGFIFINDYSEFDKCLEIGKNIGGTSLNTFSMIKSNGIFIGAVGKNCTFIENALEKIDKKYFLEKRYKKTMTCYIMIKDCFRSMATTQPLKLSIDFIQERINDILKYNIFYLSLFMYFSNKEIIDFILKLNHHMLVLNLAPIIENYKLFDEIQLIIERSKIIVGNREEFKKLSKLFFKVEENNYTDNILEEYFQVNSKTTFLICTDGDKDIMYTDNNNIYYLKPKKINEKDIFTCGAGDAFCAGVLDAFIEGKSSKNIVENGYKYSYEWIIKKTKEYKDNLKKSKYR